MEKLAKYITKVIFNNKNDLQMQQDVILRALEHYGYVKYDKNKYEYAPTINTDWENGDFYGD